MKYKTKDEVVLIHVCGEHILVATRALWPQTKLFRHIPKSTALCWDMLSKGLDDEKIIAVISALSRRPQAEIQEKLKKLWEDLYKAGYLVLVEEKESNEKI